MRVAQEQLLVHIVGAAFIMEERSRDEVFIVFGGRLFCF